MVLGQCYNARICLPKIQEFLGFEPAKKKVTDDDSAFVTSDEA